MERQLSCLIVSFLTNRTYPYVFSVTGWTLTRCVIDSEVKLIERF